MRHISSKWLCLFMATTVFLCPLLVIADDICRCPDCARRACVIKPGVCSSKDGPESSHPCCSQEGAVSQCPNARSEPIQDVNPDEPGHPSPMESRGCHCNAYIHTHGNAVLLSGETNVSSLTEEFHQQLPKTLISSGWVFQILHPPRPFMS